MAYKELLQQIALSNSELSKTICNSIIRRFHCVVKKAWETTLHYIQMEEKCREDKSLSEDEKNRLRIIYEKDQLALEQSCEMIAHLLWYYAIDEQVYRDDNLIREAIIDYKDDMIAMFRVVISTPIISSGCPNMFPVFSEVMRQILIIYGEDTITDFMAQVIKDLNTQIENTYLACGTRNLDEVDDLKDVQSNQDMILDERLQEVLNEDIIDTEVQQRNKELVKRLYGDDQLSVVFAKISSYCTMIKQCTNPVKVRLFNDHGLAETMYRLYKIQALVNRFHASKYKRDLVNQRQKLEDLKPKYQDLIVTVDWKSYKVQQDTKNEEEVFKNLYFNIEYSKIQDVTHPSAKKNEKTIVELQLDENLSHTSNLCQTQIRKLLQSLLRLFNRKKIHFSERIDIKVLEFNREIGKLIADQFNYEFNKIMEIDINNHLDIMRYCCQYSAIFGEFDRLLFQNMSSGSLLLSFVQNNGLYIVKQLILFLIEFQYQLQQQRYPFILQLCRSLQLLWSHLVDFFVQLVEGKYIDQQFSQFLISFKTNPTQKIKTSDNQKEYDIAIKRMQKYFMGLFGESLHFLFVELNENKYITDILPDRKLNVFEYFDLTSELFFFSFVELYSYVSQALTHLKIFNENSLAHLKTSQDPTIPKVSPYDTNLSTLKEMGFAEDQSLAALQETGNDIHFAIELLSNNVPLQVPEKSKREEKKPETEEDYELFEKFDEYNTYGTFTQSDLYYLIVKTFKEYIGFVPLENEVIKKQQIVENIFFNIGKNHEDRLVRDMLESCSKQILELVSEFHNRNDFRQIGILAYSVAVLLTYRRGILLKTKEAFQVIFELIDLYGLTLKELRIHIQDQPNDFNEKKVSNLISQLDSGMSLFLYISEEAKISSDLNKVNQMISPQSAFIDPIREIQTQLEQLEKLNEGNIFYQNKEQSAEIFQKVTLITIDFYKSLNNTHSKAEALEDYIIERLIKKSLENLNFLLNIKGYADFDCQSYFLKNEGLRALFGIRLISDSTKQMSAGQTRRFDEIQLQSKILLQQLSQTEQQQVKVYENLIKSVLFIQFQEKFKQQEGQDIKVLFNFEELKNSQPKIQQSSTKKKRSSTPIKFNQQQIITQLNEDRNQNTGSKGTSSKSLKQQIFRKSEYCEVLLEEFINFFSNVMQIQDLKSFLQACQNVCIIKKKQVNELANQQQSSNINKIVEEVQKDDSSKLESKQIQDKKLSDNQNLDEQALRRSKRLHKNKEEQQRKQQEEEERKAREPIYKLYLCLTNNQLKDMILQYGQQLQQQTGVQLGIQFENEKQQQGKNLSSFQEQIIFTFLDLFIDQIRDDKMIIQQQCKQASQQMGYQISQGEKSITLKDSQQRIKVSKYFFDITSILSHLTYLMTHQPILLQSLLKHKDQKTYKFIIRNIYYIMVLQIKKDKIETKEEQKNDTQGAQFSVCINDALLTSKQAEIIVEFFKRVMFENPHLTNQERKLKQDARNIFMKEVLKNLQEGQYQQKYPQWPLLGLIYNVGAVWLIQSILKDEDKENEQQNKEKVFEQLVQNMQKYRNQLRVNMIKQLICDLQQSIQQQSSSKQQQQQHQIDQQMLSNGQATQIQLIKQIQRVQNEIVANMNNLINGKDQVQLCLFAISCILKPFDSTKATWGEKDADKTSLLSESNLGFVRGRSGSQQRLQRESDQRMIEEQDEEDEDDEDEDDEEEDDEDESEDDDNDDDLLDSERSERNFRFSENEGFDEDYGDEDVDELDEDEDDDEEDEDGDIHISGGSSGSIGGDEVPQINLNDILAYGDEDDVGDEFMHEHDEDDSSRSNYDNRNNNRHSQNTNLRVGQSPRVQANQGSNQRNDLQEEDDQIDDEEYDDGDGDDESGSQLDDEYGDEDEGSDMFYDDEIDDEDNQIEIFIGRGANNQERLSNAEYGQRFNGQRRDDLLSMNNMSIDMFNMGHHGQGGRGQHLDQIQEEGSESIQNFSEDDFNQGIGQGHFHEFEQQQDRQLGNRQNLRIPHQINSENLGGVINSILGMFLGNRRGGSRGGGMQQSIQTLIEEKLNQNSVIHSPLETLQTIYELTREAQEMPALYQQYIKEQQESQQQLSNQFNQHSRQYQEDNLNKTAQKANHDDSIVELQKNQNNNSKSHQQQQKSSKNQNQQQQGVEMIQTNMNRQNLGGLEDELDPEFLNSLDDTGIQNLADTQNVMNRIYNQTHQYDHQKTISNAVQLLETITNQEQRNEIFRNMPDDIFNQLPPRLFTEGLPQRPPSRNQLHAQAQRASQQQQSQQSSQNQNQQQQREQNNQVNNQIIVSNQQVVVPLNNIRPVEFLAQLGASVGGAVGVANRRRNNRPQQQLGRDRLMSLDSQLNDMVDFSRGGNDPYFKNTSHQLAKSDIPIDANMIFTNFLRYLKDLIIEMSTQPVYDIKGNDITKVSEQVVQNNLTLNLDNLDLSYQKVHGMIDMIMVWIQLLTNGSFFMVKEQNLMRSLFRVTIIRQGVMIKLYEWIYDGIQSFNKYVQDLESSNQQQLVSVKQDGKGFKVVRGNGLPGRLDIIDFILHCLRCVKQLAQECNKISTNASLDLMKYPNNDNVMDFLIKGTLKVRKDQSINRKKQLIEQIIEQIVQFTKLVDARPDLVNMQTYIVEGKDVWMEDIISLLVNIFSQLSTAAENYQSLKKQQLLPENLKNVSFAISDQLINHIGELLLTKEFKSKDISKQIKTIFSDINKINEGSAPVQNFFKQSLSNSLIRIIDILNAKGSQIKIDNEKLNKEVIIISQILKVAKSNKKHEINICDEDLFFRIVKEISDFIDKKQDAKQSQLSFVFKEEFRTIMIALFILFEYNLKFIFTESSESKNAYTQANQGSRRRNQNNVNNALQARRQQPQVQQQDVINNNQDEQQQQQNANQGQDNQNNNNNQQQAQNVNTQVKQGSSDIIMEDISETQSKNYSKEKPDLMEQIDQHLKLKIKDEKARQDKRLRLFIKFCLQHKKIINSFIRANQQVLNESLRNVIMKVPQLLDFDNKRLLFRAQIKKFQRKYRLQYIDLNIRRDKVFDDSYAQLKNVKPERYRGQLNVEFADEQGIDEGGLSKEWFTLLSQQIFNEDLALFLQSNAGSSYYPNPKSYIQPDFKDLFRFVGRIVGKAIYENQLLDCYFVKALYKLLLGLPLNYHDVEDFDDQLYNNLSWCLNNSVQDLGITFTETVENFGKNEEIEIIPNGANIDVTDDNKHEYVKQMAYHKLYGSIKNQVDSFLQGFYDVVPKYLIQIFDNRELELLISGLPTIDIADLRENTIYTNYSPESQVVKWLFEVLEEFDNSERAEFIQFVTGSSKVPVEGFKGLRGSRGFQKFQIVKFFTNDVNRLPQAHTCFKQLELPEYQTKEQLKDRLYTAIKEGKTFGFA